MAMRADDPDSSFGSDPDWYHKKIESLKKENEKLKNAIGLALNQADQKNMRNVLMTIWEKMNGSR